MLDWLKTKLKEKKLTDRMQKHLATATGPQLNRNMIAVAMASLDDDSVQGALRVVRPDQQNVFMMVYECIVLWAILRGLASAGVPEHVQEEVALAMRDHFADHGWYTAHEFEKLWDSTQEWMPAFAKPTKDGNLWPAAALVQIPHAAGSRLDFVPDYTFGCHVLEAVMSMSDIGKYAGEQELAQQKPKPGSVLEAALEAGSVFIVSGYRSIAAQYGCAPSTMISDEKIVEIYSRVCTAFRQASERRGERIPALYLNRFVLKFLQIHEKMPGHFFDEHLRYELDRYVGDGLRPEYKQELSLF
jgi:hypothetical protein